MIIDISPEVRKFLNTSFKKLPIGSLERLLAEILLKGDVPSLVKLGNSGRDKLAKMCSEGQLGRLKVPENLKEIFSLISGGILAYNIQEKEKNKGKS